MLITPSAPGYESPPGYRANDGTDWFGIDQNVPIDSNGLLFDVGTSTPVWGGFPIFPIYASGPGTYQSGLFGHISGGPEFYEYNVATTLGAATPEPGTWAMLLVGFRGHRLRWIPKRTPAERRGGRGLNRRDSRKEAARRPFLL